MFLKAIDFYIQNLNPNGFFTIKSSDDVKYVYVEGAAVAYLLTGDDRYKKAIDLALKAWETHKGIEYTGKGGSFTKRHHGFGMLAYLHAYEITGEPKYLEKAKRYFEAAFAMQVKPVDGKAPDGAWVHAAEHHGDGNGWTTSPWMSAFLTDAIWKYWMLTGDARASFAGHVCSVHATARAHVGRPDDVLHGQLPWERPFRRHLPGTQRRGCLSAGAGVLSVRRQRR